MFSSEDSTEEASSIKFTYVVGRILFLEAIRLGASISCRLSDRGFSQPLGPPAVPCHLVFSIEISPSLITWLLASSKPDRESGSLNKTESYIT